MFDSRIPLSARLALWLQLILIPFLFLATFAIWPPVWFISVLLLYVMHPVFLVWLRLWRFSRWRTSAVVVLSELVEVAIETSDENDMYYRVHTRALDARTGKWVRYRSWLVNFDLGPMLPPEPIAVYLHPSKPGVHHMHLPGVPWYVWVL